MNYFLASIGSGGSTFFCDPSDPSIPLHCSSDRWSLTEGPGSSSRIIDNIYKPWVVAGRCNTSTQVHNLKKHRDGPKCIIFFFFSYPHPCTRLIGSRRARTLIRNTFDGYCVAAAVVGVGRIIFHKLYQLSWHSVLEEWFAITMRDYVRGYWS